MSQDGAHEGIDAQEALGAVLGGKQPQKPEMSVLEMRDWLLSADPSCITASYGECGRYAAKVILQWLMANPNKGNLPIETEYDWDAMDMNNTGPVNQWPVKQIGWSDLLKEVPEWDAVSHELTGFLYGWACNAARRCLELPPAPNPAILEIGS